MARIRSVHPSLFTDDDVMELEPITRLFMIGLWTEASDDGVFAWKPRGLKARIFPADMLDADPMLSELEAAGFIQRFEHDGKSFGAVRNFRKFQRPKKPNSSGVLPNELHKFVGLTNASSPPVPNQFPTSSEKSPQMEDGGDKMEDGRGNKKTTPLRGVERKRPKTAKRSDVFDVLSRVLDAEHSEAVIAHRAKLKKPLTAHAAKLLAGQFSQMPDANAAADRMIGRGWVGFDATWDGARPQPPPTNGAHRTVDQFGKPIHSKAPYDDPNSFHNRVDAEFDRIYGSEPN